MIDLSKFVDKEVFVTLADNSVKHGLLRKDDFRWKVDGAWANYYYIAFLGDDFTSYYTQTGNYSPPVAHDKDIVNIQLKQQKTMALSDETIERLAEALAPESVLYIRQSEEFIQFLTEQLTVFLKEKMGEMDNEVAVEIIGNLIADHISLVTAR